MVYQAVKFETKDNENIKDTYIFQDNNVGPVVIQKMV